MTHADLRQGRCIKKLPQREQKTNSISIRPTPDSKEIVIFTTGNITTGLKPSNHSGRCSLKLSMCSDCRLNV